MYEALMKKGEALPFDIRGNVIYYMGPSPAREGRPIVRRPHHRVVWININFALLDLGMQGNDRKRKTYAKKSEKP